VYLEHSYHLQGFFEVMTMHESTFPGMGETWWPFVTHFTGCQFCCGLLNSQYDAESCLRHMERACKVANDQVLQQAGYA
jgi:xyloglucan 6-xylosyltransferase